MIVGNIPQACKFELYASLVQNLIYKVPSAGAFEWQSLNSLVILPHAPFFLLLLTPFWRPRFSHFAAAGSTPSSTRVLGWKPSAHCLLVPGSTGGAPPTSPCLRRRTQQHSVHRAWQSGDCPAGCEEEPGLDSRPANKLVAICIPFHDSAVPHERIHCVWGEGG